MDRCGDLGILTLMAEGHYRQFPKRVAPGYYGN